MSQWNVCFSSMKWSAQLKYAITYFAIHFLFIFHNLFSVHILRPSSSVIFSLCVLHFCSVCICVCFSVFICRSLCLWLIFGWGWFSMCRFCKRIASVAYVYICVCVWASVWVLVPVSISLSLSPSYLTLLSVSMLCSQSDTDGIISSYVYFVYSTYFEYHKSKGMTPQLSLLFSMCCAVVEGRQWLKRTKSQNEKNKYTILSWNRIESNRILWKHVVSA